MTGRGTWTPGHLEEVRRESAVFIPGGALHLVLDVLAHAADEAEYVGSGRAVVTGACQLFGVDRG
jgi:topoisomerase IV subunit B